MTPRWDALGCRLRWSSVLLAVACLATSVVAQGTIGAPPGRLVDIGGRRLHIDCTGSGSPAVVFDGDAGSYAIDWALVQPEIAKDNRVCSYDRAGIGWSDPVKSGIPDDVADLRAALTAAGERPPYVFVGAGLGAIYVRLYLATRPDDVMAMVLIDPASEETPSTFSSGGVAGAARRAPRTGAPFDRLPKELYQTRIELDRRRIATTPQDVALPSAEAERAAIARLRDASRTSVRPAGDRPLIVLTSGIEATQELQNAHARIARISTRTRHLVVDDAGHEMQLSKPDVVIKAIQEVLESVYTKMPLSPR